MRPEEGRALGDSASMNQLPARSGRARGRLVRFAQGASRRFVHTVAAVPLLGNLVAASLLKPRRDFDEGHRARTDDGAFVALHRLLPRGAPRGSPVILCHGIACNRHFWHLSPETSFARALADAGRDVWVLEMRGHGQSHRVRPLRYWESAGIRWDFDHYVHHDLPAAIAYVRRTAAAEKVDWIGHSMGGMVIYAYLGTTGGEDVGNVVTLGTPTFIDNRFWAWRVANAFRTFTRYTPHVPVRIGAAAVSGMVLAFHRIIPQPIYNAKNMRARDSARLFHNVLDDVSGGEVALGTQFIHHRGFRSRDGQVSYAERLREIRHPVLAVAGAADYLVMPRDVKAAFERLGSADKRLVILSQNNGCRHDYGHADLVLGRHVGEEVVPLVLGWLEERTR